MALVPLPYDLKLVYIGEHTGCRSPDACRWITECAAALIVLNIGGTPDKPQIEIEIRSPG